MSEQDLPPPYWDNVLGNTDLSMEPVLYAYDPSPERKTITIPETYGGGHIDSFAYGVVLWRRTIEGKVSVTQEPAATLQTGTNTHLSPVNGEEVEDTTIIASAAYVPPKLTRPYIDDLFSCTTFKTKINGANNPLYERHIRVATWTAKRQIQAYINRVCIPTLDPNAREGNMRRSGAALDWLLDQFVSEKWR